ncbi:autoinducer synthase [Roseovarius faecimaris]|uniref:Acyl-homoserine-lactone synthase n=1 Tax=Roseovarius faecimaris TaxID=2494550 RepID=A0A6I6IQ21_9RHOB|nr:acyl-homoserine-lactone synthase [Roseovarius faecimaris]QGX97306.1 autoinducer synthase [Roseovarius faecimaris]
MLRYIHARALGDFPKLQEGMFRDRADQFKTRLNWDVEVDANGQERDAYDALNPLYVLWQNRDGGHGGSMRLLPTTGSTMVADHFAHLLRGRIIEDRAIWECTRFCLSRQAEPRVAAALMLAGGEVMRHFGITHYVGVFDARMERIYRAIGSEPEIIGSEGTGLDRISVGLWSFTEEARQRVARRAGISPELSQLWVRRSLGAKAQDELLVT